MMLVTDDKIWLTHLRGHKNKWLALAGEYPYRLVGVGDDAVKAMTEAGRNGHPDAMLFMVPPSYPLCVTPF